VQGTIHGAVQHSLRKQPRGPHNRKKHLPLVFRASEIFSVVINSLRQQEFIYSKASQTFLFCDPILKSFF